MNLIDPPAIASDVPESKFGNMLQVIDPPAIAFCLVACGLIVIVAQAGAWLEIPL